jgi:Fe2+ transport system protein FeoA
MNDILLSEAPHNQELQITRVRTREPDRLEYLTALGLIPGAQLQVIHAAPFSGPLQLHLGREYRIIGHNLAELIRVKVGE